MNDYLLYLTTELGNSARLESQIGQEFIDHKIRETYVTIISDNDPKYSSSDGTLLKSHTKSSDRGRNESYYRIPDRKYTVSSKISSKASSKVSHNGQMKHISRRLSNQSNPESVNQMTITTEST